MNNRKRFLQLLSSKQPDLATGALLIARHFQPTMDIDAELAFIDQLSANAQKNSVTDIHSLVRFFEHTGYRGNTNDYYDVNNSLLNKVLHRKVGIPITLGVVYLAVVKRLDQTSLTARGINFPGHFLIAVRNGNSEQLIDVFDVRVTNQHECYTRFTQTAVKPDPLHFRHATERDVLSRILENLKAIYWQAEQVQTVIDCLDYQLMIFPDSKKLLEQQQRLLHNLKYSSSSSQIIH